MTLVGSAVAPIIQHFHPVTHLYKYIPNTCQDVNNTIFEYLNVCLHTPNTNHDNIQQPFIFIMN